MPSHAIEIFPRVDSFTAGVEALRDIPSSVIGDAMGRLVGTALLRPIHRSSLQACGNAVTVRVRAGDNLMIHKALDLLQPGDILLVDGEGDTSRALVGEIMMTTARVRGAVAFVMNGAVRDVDAFEAERFPCWARGASLRGPYKDGPGSINAPITIDGMVVSPGDIVVADSDGVVAIPPAQALEVARLSREKLMAEQATIAQILAGTYSSAWVDATLQHKTGS